MPHADFDAVPPRRVRRRAQKPPRSGFWWFLWRLFVFFFNVAVFSSVVLLCLAWWAYQYYGSDLPDPSTIGQYRPAETSQIYARDGQTLLYELIDPQGGRRTVVPFDQIPQVLKDATIAVEDADFYNNPGVDLRGIIRATLQNYQAQEVVSGASTITQQLVRNVLLPPEERTRISFERKLREAILAYRVSREYSKDQILSMYLNEVYYGNQAYGVEAAAQSYFGKHVWELNSAEATLLAGLPQSPTILNPFENMEGAKARQKVTLDLMAKHGFLSEFQAEQYALARIDLVPQTVDLLTPHFVFYVREQLEKRYGPDILYRGGLKIITTIDLDVQAQAQQIVVERIAELRERNATNAGVIMLSPDGQILAMVGSIGYNDPTIDGEVNVTLAERQPGSALKPVVYAAALQKGWTPATVIWDTPIEYPQANGTVYAPRNYDNNWHGPQRLRMALANSLNIPAIKAIEYTGVEAFVELAHRMGITTLNDPDRYGLSMALGSGEVRLLDLTTVYNTFRNGGRLYQPVSVLKITNSRGEVLEQFDAGPGRQVLGPNGEQIAYLITDILSDNQARTYMFGAGNTMELADGRPAAVKTGTSNDWKDSWAIGYTPQITVGVWVGNNDSSQMQEIAGSNGAASIWQKVMDSYLQGQEIQGFQAPPGITTVAICAHTGALAGDGCPAPMEEKFVAGTEPKTSDVIVRQIQVAGDGNCLAASYTPADQIRTVNFLAYPAEFHDWAAQVGIPQPPTTFCPPPVPTPSKDTNGSAGSLANISYPAEGEGLTASQIFIRGDTAGPYTLEFGEGKDPQRWQPISGGSMALKDGILGVWQTMSLAKGEYTLRLRVSMPGVQPIEMRRLVQIN